MGDVQQALDGLVALWADTFCDELYTIQDRAYSADQLKPYVKAALAEPGSSVHKYIERYMCDRPQMVQAWAIYDQWPQEVRQVVVDSRREKLKDRLYLWNRIFYPYASWCIIAGWSAAKTDKQLRQSFERALCSLSLKELREPVSSEMDEAKLHTWLSLQPLFPGSVAGADRRLKNVLSSRLKAVSGAGKVNSHVTDYEQDVKVALWECYVAGRESLYQALRTLLGKRGNDTDELSKEQMDTLRRIVGEPDLLRTLLLRVVRKTIADLPDISDAVRERRRYEDNRVTMNDDWFYRQKSTKIEDGGYNRTECTMEELRACRDQLTARELDVYQGELERMEAGKTRKQWYGREGAECVKQQVKYIKKKHS